MARGYTREHYLAVIEKCFDRIPHFAPAGDFIVGFPGERDADFEQTEQLVRRVRYQNLFCFKYSPRPGTAAAARADDVPQREKEARHRRLLELQQTRARGLYGEHVGTDVEVLVEGPSTRNPRMYTGRTRTGKIVIFPPTAAPGELRDVRIHRATALALYGDIVPEEKP
jgi:tRNA-2-methylthio-N6-dimethylallyladenosine synthase